MLHVVRLIERRFPNHGRRAVIVLLLLSASALALGAGLAMNPP